MCKNAIKVCTAPFNGIEMWNAALDSYFYYIIPVYVLRLKKRIPVARNPRKKI